jgi:hypothetical protein
MSSRIGNKLMQALVEKTGLKPPTIYAKIADIARADGRGCKNLVYALEYAHQNGLNPQKFADSDTLKEYREYRRAHVNEPTVITKTQMIPVKLLELNSTLAPTYQK